ncbi:alpha-ketoacid dehydrogenase subunit beta [Bhargavaea beijingensis]|uniref:alpha-ketoacid dehydrogenase subunit beta n=1 Tax=Bhargavaea beijingensis TaxID=426756 RepID=UPI0038733081
MTLLQAINKAMAEEMERDDRVLILGEDVGKNGGVFRATDGLIERFGERRVVDTPIAESAIIGAAVGMAAKGLRPIAEIQFMGFIFEAMDEMAAQAARIRFRSAGAVTAPMVIRAPYGGGIGAPELHSDSLEAHFIHSPGLKVVMPSTPFDAKGLLTAAIRDPDPVLFLEPMKLYRSFEEEIPEEPYSLEIGKAEVRKEGADVTLISWGPPVHQCLRVAEKWENEKAISVEVIDVRTLAPLDRETILASVRKTGRAVIVHEAVKTGGAGAEISAIISEEAVYSLSGPIVRVGGFDTPYPPASLEMQWLPTDERIEEALEQALEE